MKNCMCWCLSITPVCFILMLFSVYFWTNNRAIKVYNTQLLDLYGIVYRMVYNSWHYTCSYDEIHILWKFTVNFCRCTKLHVIQVLKCHVVDSMFVKSTNTTITSCIILYLYALLSFRCSIMTTKYFMNPYNSVQNYPHTLWNTCFVTGDMQNVTTFTSASSRYTISKSYRFSNSVF